METTERAGTEVTLDIPQVYKNYLVPRRLFCDLKLLCVHVFGLTATWMMWMQSRHGTGAHSHLAHLISRIVTSAVYVFVAFIIWRDQGTRPWQYVMDERHFQVIEWQHQGRFWQWHSLVWDREVISAVEEGERRGLPTLCLETMARKPQDRRTYVLVYSHEDRERVISQIVPLIQHYRRRFRHEFWCEQLQP